MPGLLYTPSDTFSIVFHSISFWSVFIINQFSVSYQTINFYFLFNLPVLAAAPDKLPYPFSLNNSHTFFIKSSFPIYILRLLFPQFVFIIISIYIFLNKQYGKLFYLPTKIFYLTSLVCFYLLPLLRDFFFNHLLLFLFIFIYFSVFSLNLLSSLQLQTCIFHNSLATPLFSKNTS